MLTTDDGAPAVVQPAFAPGAIIDGRYRLVSRLGSGGGGTVWRCFDEKLQMTVAFKIVSDDVDVERWRREVAMARRIADRNVCRVHDLGETAEVRFVTMELVEGASLRSKCTPELPAAEARDLVRQIVSGVAAIHAAGVVHRDLKPENIVVDASGRAVIVDFGLARANATGATMNLRAGGGSSAAVTSTGMIMGTPRYMSPEQAVGDTVDARTDVYALGLIAYELLSGRVPPLQEGGGRHVGDVAKWPAATAVVKRCLSLFAKDRYDDARAIAAALVERKRGGRAIAIVLGAALAGTAAFFGVRKFTAKDDVVTPVPIVPVKPIDGVEIVQITSTDQWPMAAPMSVALSPDGTRFAYTTAVGELRVRALAGGEAKAWTLPVIARRDDPGKAQSLLTVWAAGWYADGSIAVVGMLRGGEWRLFRVREDGTHALLHASTERFPVAIAGEQTVIAKHGQALFAVLANEQLQQLATVGNGERVLALAASPDGKRIASTRVPAAANEDLTVQVTTIGGDTKIVWHGPHLAGDFLVWLDGDRIAFAVGDPAQRFQIVAHDLRTGTSMPRTEWSTDTIGIGTSAAGTTLVLRGPATPTVQLGDKDGWPLQRLHDGRAHALAGWTTDNRVVFALGEPGKEQIVRASIASGIEPWPTTRPGVEHPDAVVDYDVIAHRTDGGEIVIERIDPAGGRTELQRVPKMLVTTFVRCAGERAAPCVLERVDDTQVSWTALDPLTGALGKTHHRRPLRSHHHARSAALTPDGKYLAIVEGTNEVHLVATADAAGDLALRTVQTRDADAIQSIAFAPDSRLWVSSIGYGGRQFGLARYYWGAKTEKISTSGSAPLFDKQSLMRSYGRAAPSPDMTSLAVEVRERKLEIARIDGL